MSATAPSVTISKSVLLLAEGQDEVNFFGALLGHMGIGGDVQIVCYNGVTNLDTKLRTILISPGHHLVRRYAVIRDAETTAQAAFAAVTSAVQACGHTCPHSIGVFTDSLPSVGVFILPGTGTGRMLEDLCLRTVSDDPVMACVTAFMTCVEEKMNWRDPHAPTPAGQPYRFPNNSSKAKARAFLATREDDLPSVGVAAQAGVWNLDHECLGKLRAFLTEFAQV